MKRNVLLPIFVICALVRHSLALETDQCEDGSALPTLTAAQVTTLTSCVSPSYTCATAGELYCGTGTNCLAATNWCDGSADGSNDCTSNVDEGTTAREYCSTGACTGCTTLTTADHSTGGTCKPVLWTPPVSAEPRDVMIADCNHFPGTTFPTGATTEVVYTLDVDSLTPHRYCVFEVMMNAGPCVPPVTNCPGETQTVTADAGESTAIVSWTEVTTDSTATIAIDNESHRLGSEFPIGYTRVEYTITQTADNTMKSYCIFYVHVKASATTPSSLNCDMLQPIMKIITPPDDSEAVTTELDAFLNQLPAGVAYTLSIPSTAYEFPLGSNQFHVILQDGSETITCSDTVTIEYPTDTADPVISGCPATVDVCYSTGTTIVGGSWTPPTATDDVAIKSFTSNIEPGTLLTIPAASDPAVTATYTAVDYEDKTTTCTFTLNFVEDTQSPTVQTSTCVAFTEYTSAAVGSQVAVNFDEPMFLDNCKEELTITKTKSPGDMFTVPSTTPVTYTAQDKAMNAAVTCTFNVIVTADAPPTFSNCPTSPLTFPTVAGQTYGTVTWTAPTIADDNNLNVANVILTMVDAQNVAVPNLNAQDATVNIPQLAQGTYTVTYSYTDVALQEQKCVFEVIVRDEAAPTFMNCPTAIERDLTAGQPSVMIEWQTPTAMDSPPSDVNVVLSEGQASGSSFESGQYTIKYTATDAAGNMAECTFIITVNAYDANEFWMNCPSSIPSQDTDVGKPTAVVTWTPPTVRNDVTNPQVTVNYPPGTSFPIGDTSVVYNVADAANNQDVCQFTVTIVDNEAPVIFNCPEPVTAYGRTGQGVPVYWVSPEATDNSGGIVILSPSPFGPGTTFTYGSHQIVYTAADPSNNQRTGCTTSVSVSISSDPDAVTGTAEFSAIRGLGSTNAVSQSQNLADDMEALFRQNTPISSDVADVTVGTPSALSSGNVVVPFTIYLQHCRASYTRIRDSLTQGLRGENEDTFATNNVIIPSTFTLNTKEFIVTNLQIARDLNRAAAQQELLYNADYRNPHSPDYQTLEDRVCDVMDNVYAGFAEYCGCDVWEYRAGSVIADVVLIFGRNSPVSDTGISNQLQNSITNGQLQNLILENTLSIRVAEVCPSGYCQNGGTCQPNSASYTSQCTCAPNYTGDQCQTYTGLTTRAPTTAAPRDSGLSTEEIIGIVVGALGGLLLFVILCACCCIFCMGPSDPKSVPIIQQQEQPIIAVNNPKPPVLVRDVIGPRPSPPRPTTIPIPRPVPVARPFPVPFPVRTPVPTPVRVPVPTPVPAPFPVPFRQPFPVQQPIPLPVPRPYPVPTPVRIPVNVGVPIRNASGLGTGFGPSGFNTGNNVLALNNGLNTGLNTGFNGFNTTGF